MKYIYFYDTETKLLSLEQPYAAGDDFECSVGSTDKQPDLHKRARFLIKFDENNNDWVYEKRDTILWCHVTDTPKHRERKRYYDAALYYYTTIKQIQDIDYIPDNNPDDLLQFLKDNEDMEIIVINESLTLKDVVGWIERYEAEKDMNVL